MKHFGLAIVLVICAIGSSARAWAKVAGGDGNDLEEECKAAIAGETGARAGLCVGFINAYRQIAAMIPDQKLLCDPANTIRNEQFIKVLVKYLDEHPEKLHLAGTQLVYDAMSEAFPCPAGKK